MKHDRSIHEFVAEAEELLESANKTLTEIESSLRSGASEPEQLNALFRSVHTFKGLAGIFELKEPLELSHRLESLLDALRLGKVEVRREVVDVLSETIGVLARLVRQAAAEQPFDSITAALNSIDRILTLNPVREAEHQLLHEIELDPGILQVLTEYEEHRLKQVVRERKNLFACNAVFQLAAFESELKELNKTLKKHGEIICTLPTVSGDKGDGIAFTMVIATKEDGETLASGVGKPNVSIRAIAYRDRARVAESKNEPSPLKAISNTVRVDIYKLEHLMDVVGEIHQIRNIMGRISRELTLLHGASGIAKDLQKAERALLRKVNELQTGILDARMVPVGQIFSRLSQVVSKYVRDAGKDIDFQLRGEETELDKLMVEDLADPLMHLIRNAIDHGIEPQEVRKKSGKPPQGIVLLSAFPRGNNVVITVEDDGAGMDARNILRSAVEKGLLNEDHGLDPERDRKQIFDMVFLPGFSTRETVTELSGRGVGMDVVKKNVSKLSGIVEIESELGSGTQITITLPITLAIIKAMIVESGKQTFAIPLSSVLEVSQVSQEQIETVEGAEVMAVRGETIPLLRLNDVFKLLQESEQTIFSVVFVGLAERRLGIIVDGLRDQQEIVIKTLGKKLADIPGIAGATELGDKRGIVLVLDIESLMETASQRTAIRN